MKIKLALFSAVLLPLLVFNGRLMASYPDMPVSLATLPALSAGTAVIGHVVVDSAPTTTITAASLPLPSGAATDSSVTGLEVTQGSTTSGQSGPLVQGAVTTAAPSYTTAKTSPLSLNVSGGLRVDGSGVTQPVSLASLPSLAAGTALIGHVVVDTAPTTAVTIATLPSLAAGSAVIGHVIADSGSTTAVTGTVTANATLSAETTKVIGTVNIASGQTIGLSSGSAVIGHVIADSGSTTAVTGTVTANATLSAETTKVIGTVNVASGQTIGLSSGSAVIGHVIVDTAPSTAVTLAAAATAIAKAEDSASADADVGVPSMAIQQSSPADTAGTNGDYAMLQMSAGRLWVSAKIDTALPAGTAVIGHVIADSGSTTAVTGTVTANATLSAETTKVIGTVNVSASQTIGINDGTNTAKVEAASTAAAAADKALVVSQNPSGGNPCLNPTATLTSITGATSTTNATQIVALSGSTKIYICSMTIIGVSGTSPTFSLVQGTGSNCVTGQTNVVQAWATTAGTLYAFANPVAVGVAGNELCYKDGGTTPVQNYQINYVQQ